MTRIPSVDLPYLLRLGDAVLRSPERHLRDVGILSAGTKRPAQAIDGAQTLVDAGLATFDERGTGLRATGALPAMEAALSRGDLRGMSTLMRAHPAYARFLDDLDIGWTVQQSDHGYREFARRHYPDARTTWIQHLANYSLLLGQGWSTVNGVTRGSAILGDGELAEAFGEAVGHVERKGVIDVGLLLVRLCRTTGSGPWQAKRDLERLQVAGALGPMTVLAVATDPKGTGDGVLCGIMGRPDVRQVFTDRLAIDGVEASHVTRGRVTEDMPTMVLQRRAPPSSMASRASVRGRPTSHPGTGRQAPLEHPVRGYVPVTIPKGAVGQPKPGLPDLPFLLSCAGRILSRPGMTVDEIGGSLRPNLGLNEGRKASDALVEAGLVTLSGGRHHPTDQMPRLDAAIRAGRLADVSVILERVPTYARLLSALAAAGPIEFRPQTLANAFSETLYGGQAPPATLVDTVRYAILLDRAWKDVNTLRPVGRTPTLDETWDAFSAIVRPSTSYFDVTFEVLMPRICQALQTTPRVIARSLRELHARSRLDGYALVPRHKTVRRNGYEVIAGNLSDIRLEHIPVGHLEIDGVTYVAMGSQRRRARPQHPGPVPSFLQAAAPEEARVTPPSVDPLVADVTRTPERDPDPITEPTFEPALNPPPEPTARSDGMPWGWTVVGSGTDRVIRDERGRMRSRLGDHGEQEPGTAPPLVRYEARVMPDGDTRTMTPRGMSRVAVTDAGRVVTTSRPFASCDEAARDRALAAMAGWLDEVRPGSGDPGSHWGEPGLVPPGPIGGHRAAHPARGVVTMPDRTSFLPDDDAFLAIGFEFAARRRGIAATLPPGWSCDRTPFVVLDAGGRARTQGDGRIPDRLVVALLPRHAVREVVGGSDEGRAIGLGLGRSAVTITDAGVPTHVSPEYRTGDRARAEHERGAMTATLDALRPDHADPCAYWSDERAP